MAYTKQTWADLPAKTSPFSAERMNHIENGLSDFGKLLWQGNFTEGSITVEGSTNYSIFIIQLSNNIICFGSKYYGGGILGSYGSYNREMYTYRVGGVGDTWTISDADRGGSNGAQNLPIIKIYGLF